MIRETLVIAIVLTIDFLDCPLTGIVWTINVWGFQLIEIVQTNYLGDCLMNWNCPENSFHRLSMKWNCQNNRCLVLLMKWNCPDKWSRRLSINWNCPESCFHRLSINWNCLNNWFRVIYMHWNCWHSCWDKSFRRPSIIELPISGQSGSEGSFIWKPAVTTVQFIDLVSTLHYQPILVSLTGSISSLYTQPLQGTAVLCFTSCTLTYASAGPV